MPIHTGQDKNGKFYQWGKTGKKYYFKPGDEASRKRARGKAEAQQTAIYSSGWKGDKQTMKLIKVKKCDADMLTLQDVKKIRKAKARLLDSMNAFAHEFRAVYKGRPELAEKERLWNEAYDKLNEIFE